MAAIRKALFLFLLLLLSCSAPDPDRDFFVSNYARGDDLWLQRLDSSRQIDMFFASHRTRPASYYVDQWIIDNKPDLLKTMRGELDRRGTDEDVEAYLHIVDRLHANGTIDAKEVNTLNLAPLCKRAQAAKAVCASGSRR
ncbi:hypothetical protein XpiCFBP4643_21045 [Xanthomonas pisi]|uniref:Lipoprotein n=1 Tax=Xanthomonas pisi TaxID=56457 RepID=A0A2S7CV15_9XANT|nr:hypothetical protein XpiCFBP4643_21045 [Xanthomonas pisi]